MSDRAERRFGGQRRAAETSEGEAFAGLAVVRGGDLDADAVQPPPAPPGWPQGAPWLRGGRVHEVEGRASRAFAASVAALAAALTPAEGAVVWIRPREARGRIDGFGAAALFDPDRLVVVQAAAAEDGLWAMEESLRSGAAALVVLEARRRPDLTAGRRLQLAAEAAQPPPIGLVLVDPDDLGGGRRDRGGRARETVSAAETRWRVEPAPAEDAAADGPAWLWRLDKNKRGPVGAWRVRLRAAPLRSSLTAPEAARKQGATDAAATDRLALDAAAWRGASAAA